MCTGREKCYFVLEEQALGMLYTGSGFKFISQICSLKQDCPMSAAQNCINFLTLYSCE